MKIGFYPGCSLKGSSREYNESVVAIAKALDIELVEIKDWNCCGATAAHSMNEELSLSLPARILALAEAQGLKEVVVPCDAAGFKPLTAIFNWDYTDKLYNAHLEKTTLVTFSCAKADKSCFCTSVNGGPGNTTGSDVLLTMLPDGGAIVEILTPKGEALVQLAASAFENDKGEDKSKYLADVPQAFDIEEVRARLATAFDSSVWKEQSERCLGCGA